MTTAWIVTIVWLFFAALAGLRGKVKINNKSLPPLWGMLVAPFLVLLIGMIFVGFGLVFTSPIWIWWMGNGR